ncbi:MAG TPA: hypothetical protein GXX18_14270 [Bacillales bacterium]|nr:hypothetical protein [Bacillales bacterium]
MDYYYDYERQFGFPGLSGGGPGGSSGFTGSFPSGGFPGGGGIVDRRLDRIENQLQRHTDRLNRLNRRLQRVERQLGYALESWE